MEKHAPAKNSNAAQITSSKFRKKWVRSRAKLEKEQFELSEFPTPYLLISNAGLGNGVKRDEMEALLSPFQHLVMPVHKSYAIAAYDTVRQAESVVQNLQGCVLKSATNLAAPSVTLYFHYVKDLEKHLEYLSHVKSEGNVPEGLYLLEDFISEKEEGELLDFLAKENSCVKSDVSTNNLKHRKVWHYGYEFRYKYNDVDPNAPMKGQIPLILEEMIQKITSTGHVKKRPDQITINSYEPGQGIPPHVDNASAFEDGLASLSLGSQTIMDFRKVNGVEYKQVSLKPRSLLIFTGEARYKWTHGICPRKVDLVPTIENCPGQALTPVNRGTRVSITFRKVRDDYESPDITMETPSPNVSYPATELEAESLEKLHVHKVYEEIASHFTSTRDKPWPKVKQFIDSMESYSLVLDVGCGSGRYLGVRKEVYMTGCDMSENLINICKDKGFEVLTCKGLNLPIRVGVFDACICIAVIHHYSTFERRKNSIQQLLTVVKPGGKILISVWALEQEYKRIKSKYLKRIDDKVCEGEDSMQEPLSASSVLGGSNDVRSGDDGEHGNAVPDKLPIHKNRTPFQQQDVLVPWHRKPVVSKGSDLELHAKARESDPMPNCDIENGMNGDKNKNCETFHRLYHVFKQGELDELCRSIPGVDILNSYYDEGNWCVILQKRWTLHPLLLNKMGSS